MNFEFKGTKGKWGRVKREATKYYPERNEIQYGIDGECVAEFVANDYDAKLISKAPELFEFIKKYYKFLNLGDQEKAEQLLKETTEL